MAIINAIQPNNSLYCGVNGEIIPSILLINDGILLIIKTTPFIFLLPNKRSFSFYNWIGYFFRNEMLQAADLPSFKQKSAAPTKNVKIKAVPQP